MTVDIESGMSPTAAAVTAARDALHSVAGAPLWSLRTEQLGGLLQSLVAARAQIDGLLCDVAREADARAIGKEVGARDTVGWLRAVGLFSRRDARDLTALASATDPDSSFAWATAPLVGRALRTGGISAAHAAVITDAMTSMPAQLHDDRELRIEVEQWLVDQA